MMINENQKPDQTMPNKLSIRIAHTGVWYHTEKRNHMTPLVILSRGLQLASLYYVAA